MTADLATARALLVASPGLTLQADIETIDAALVTSPTSVVVTDIQTLNTLLNGATAGSTVQARIAAANSALDGVQSLSGLTTFTVTTPAANPGGNTVNLVGNDDTLSNITYSMTYSSPIASGATFALNTGGKSITFVNNSGSSITSVSALTTYLASAYPANSIIKANTSAKVTALQTFLGGAGYSAMSKAVAIDAALLTSPTGVVATDIQTLNAFLNGIATGSTVQARIGSLGSAASFLAMLGVTGATSLTTSLGNTSAGNSALAALLGGTPGTAIYNIIVGGSGILSQIDGTTTDSGNVVSKLTTQIQAIQSSATQLSTATSAVNSALGASGTTIARANTANSLLDGVQSLSGLTSFTVSAAASNSSGTVAIIGNDGTSGRSYNVDTSAGGINLGDGTGGTTFIASGATIILTHNGSGNTITFVNNSGSNITSAATLATYLANAYPVSSFIKANANTKAIALKTLLGGAGYSAMSNAVAIDAALLASPTGVVATDIQALNTLLNGVPTGSTVQARIGSPILGGNASNLAAVIGGTSTNLATQLGDPGDGNTILSNIGGSTTSVQAALDALSTTLSGNPQFSSTLNARATTVSASLDNGLGSLPGVGTYATIGTAAASDGSGGVNIVISGGLVSANGTYNLLAATITGNIENGASFTLSDVIDSGNSLVLVNRSGATISTQAQALSYLRSMYPATSKIAAGISDKISSVNTMLGGTGTSAHVRIAAVDRSLLISPTGVVAADLNAARDCFMKSRSATLEEDARALNHLLNGTTTGSTVQDRIETIDAALLTSPTGVITDDLAAAQFLLVPSPGVTLEADIKTLGTAIDGSPGAVAVTGGGDFGFISYSGTTSQVFADENVTVSSNTITVSIGGENYIYNTSSSSINNGDAITFAGSGGKLLVLTYIGGGISNGNANANASDLQSALLGFFPAGSSITPDNLSSKVAALGESIDGATSFNVMAGLDNLKTAIDGSSGFSIADTTGSDFTVPAYNGITSQVFGAGAFSNGGATTISVTIGTDTYTYDNTGVTNIGGYGTIRFTSGSKSLIVQNNTGNRITAGSDQQVADAIVTALNTNFGAGSRLSAGSLITKIGTPTVNSTPSSLAAVIGGSGDIASRLGDPVLGTGGISALINASTASNSGIFNDVNSFKSAASIHEQLSAFLALFDQSNLTSGTSITFDCSGGAPSSLADFISRVVASA